MSDDVGSQAVRYRTAGSLQKQKNPPNRVSVCRAVWVFRRPLALHGSESGSSSSVGSLGLLTSMQNDLPRDSVAPQAGVVTVSQLLRSVRDTLERRFPLMWIRGELSNLSRAPSGHCYFTLKDDGAQVDCVMFRSRLAAVDWELRNGAQVEVRAL